MNSFNLKNSSSPKSNNKFNNFTKYLKEFMEKI